MSLSSGAREDGSMTNDDVELIRRAYDAYGRGDVVAMLGSVDRDLEWTYLDPAQEDPEPQICRGRAELQTALERQTERGLRTEMEEIVGNGDRVMVVTRTPGIEAHRVNRHDDRNFTVLTVRDGRIVSLRACRDRREALAIAGIE
jgi:ketosteroid isomerase-like protein